MRELNLKFILSGIVGLSFVSACDSSTTETNPIAESARSGRSNSSVDPRYIDTKPSLDTAGTKIVFTSGRDGGTPRIYKSTFSGTAWSAPAKVSSSTLLSQEFMGKISPDGNWILIEGSTSSGRAISLCSFGAETCSTVTSSVWGQGSFDFSPDSSMFFISSGTKSSGATIFVADVATPTTLVQLAGQDQWLDAFWATNSAPFTLITTTDATTIGKMSLYSRSLTNAATAAAAIATALPTTITSGAILRNDAASSNFFTALSPIKPSNSKLFDEFGTFEYTDSNTSPKIHVTNEIQIFTVAGAITTPALSQPAIETASAFLTSDDASVFTLNRVASRCLGDTSSTYGFSIAILNRSSGEATWLHLKKPIDLSQGPTLSSDPCDRTINGSATTFDFAPTEFLVNRNATATSYTMTWSSDMGGDPEIYVATLANGTSTSFNVSGNRVP